MEYRRNKNTVALRLDKGDDITESLLKLAKEENILSASVSGIGATDDFTVGVFDLETKKYKESNYTGNHEIVSLTGNLSTMNGENYLHLHILCAVDDGKSVGGHLLKAKISLTAEIIVEINDIKIDRKRNEGLGINTWLF